MQNPYMGQAKPLDMMDYDALNKLYEQQLQQLNSAQGFYGNQAEALGLRQASLPAPRMDVQANNLWEGLAKGLLNAQSNKQYRQQQSALAQIAQQNLEQQAKAEERAKALQELQLASALAEANQKKAKAEATATFLAGFDPRAGQAYRDGVDRIYLDPLVLPTIKQEADTTNYWTLTRAFPSLGQAGAGQIPADDRNAVQFITGKTPTDALDDLKRQQEAQRAALGIQSQQLSNEQAARGLPFVVPNAQQNLAQGDLAMQQTQQNMQLAAQRAVQEATQAQNPRVLTPSEQLAAQKFALEQQQQGALSEVTKLINSKGGTVSQEDAAAYITVLANRGVPLSQINQLLTLYGWKAE